LGDGCPARLAEAMRHSLLAPGKRMRPLLVLLGAEACGGSIEAAMPAACAVEMVHAYSLIHDDLPALDDDDLRRGRPTCHKAFDEATAILAGDALLTLAFEILAREIEPKATAAACCAALAEAAGACNMVGGQVDDLAAERSGQWSVDSGQRGERREVGGESTKYEVRGENAKSGLEYSPFPLAGERANAHLIPNPQTLIPSSNPQSLTPNPSSLPALQSIHRRKTGAMIRVSLRLGAMVAAANAEQMRALDTYGNCLGLAFQITDDLLDVQGTEDAMGKRVGKDAGRKKLTFPGLLGLDQSDQHARQLVDSACQALSAFGSSAKGLQALARYVLERNR
jgi:geranylgeranyl diphosphate synthase type II